ncbi:major histocompatibility complex class I-related gene protein-like [Gadus macrocephalus]|uniref:major histocompatibility complex class I-related gene protein-like n=1 Tax=Gadus macrocephalus TaxID=80720 RepID=UPI0028CB6172|nr:major histocompatibility complex class I-related gene protein-like [Gadus macrocephalus]
MKALTGLLLLVFGHGVSSVLHSLHYFYTGSSGLTTFPEFVSVAMVDGVQIDYYDSNTEREVLKQDWMELVTRDDPDYMERNTGSYQGAQQAFKANIGIAKQRFNQTGDAPPRRSTVDVVSLQRQLLEEVRMLRRTQEQLVQVEREKLLVEREKLRLAQAKSD